MHVVIKRTDFFDKRGYLGAELYLPAARETIEDALQQARVSPGQPCSIIFCYDGNEFQNCLPKSLSLYETSFLVSRYEKMDDSEKAAFLGCAKMEKVQPDVSRLINISYNLQGCHCVPAENDTALGRFFIAEGFFKNSNDVPEDFLQYLDFEKIGRAMREAGNGVFVDDQYVVNEGLPSEFQEVYDGIHLPGQPEPEDFVFKLDLAKLPQDDGTATPCVTFLLPASDEDIQKVLKQLDVESLEDCMFYGHTCIVPDIEGELTAQEDMNQLNELAARIKEINDRGELPKYKAILQFYNHGEYDTLTIDDALRHAADIDCYDFFPEVLSPKDYGRKIFAERTGFPNDDLTFKYLNFENYGCAMMEENGLGPTDYGYIRWNGKPLTYEFTEADQSQQMGGL